MKILRFFSINHLFSHAVLLLPLQTKVKSATWHVKQLIWLDPSYSSTFCYAGADGPWCTRRIGRCFGKPPSAPLITQSDSKLGSNLFHRATFRLSWGFNSALPLFAADTVLILICFIYDSWDTDTKIDGRQLFSVWHKYLKQKRLSYASLVHFLRTRWVCVLGADDFIMRAFLEHLEMV